MPLGNNVSATGALAADNPYRFSTKPIDDDVGVPLYYYGYRFYDPVMGRWLNRDPIEEQGGLNLYGMVGNNALGHFDTDGRAWWAPFEGWKMLLLRIIAAGSTSNGHLSPESLPEPPRITPPTPP